MAERASTSGKGGSRRGAGGDARARALRVALAIAAEGGWRDAALSEVAERAGITVADLCAIAPTKAALVALIVDDIDRQVLAGGPAEAGDSMRHRLFDLLMRRFDALNRNRAGVQALLRDGGTDPGVLLCVTPRVMQSMAMTLEAAGLSTSGLRGFARVNGLAAVYGYAFRTWLTDDTPDMAATMAALDKALARAGVVASRLEAGLGARRRPTGGTSDVQSDAT